MYKKFLFVLLIFFIPNFCFSNKIIKYNYTVNTSTLQSSLSSNTPQINAKHAVVLDRASKQVLFGKDENKQCKMASTTKIMTAIIVIENCENLKQVVTISKNAARNRRF